MLHTGDIALIECIRISMSILFLLNCGDQHLLYNICDVNHVGVVRINADKERLIGTGTFLYYLYVE